MEYRKLAIVVRVPQATQNLAISGSKKCTKDL